MMKKIILFLFVIGFALIGCKDKNQNIIDKGQFDPDAMIILRPASGVKLRSTISGLTALQVVEQALAIKWQTHYGAMGYTDEIKEVARSFREEQKDYNAPALLMMGFDVITPEGEYEKTFTYAFNVFITDSNGDTIAHVPDQVIATARPLIEDAYEQENYTEVYRIFNEAFTFQPISE